MDNGKEMCEESGGRDEKAKSGDNQGILEESSKCWFSEHIFHRMMGTTSSLTVTELTSNKSQ